MKNKHIFMLGNSTVPDILRKEFEAIGCNTCGFAFDDEKKVFYTVEINGKCRIRAGEASDMFNLLSTHPEYTYIECKKPKFKRYDVIKRIDGDGRPHLINGVKWIPPMKDYFSGHYEYTYFDNGKDQEMSIKRFIDYNLLDEVYKCIEDNFNAADDASALVKLIVEKMKTL